MNWNSGGNQFGESRMSSFNSPGTGGGFLDRTFGESPSSQEKKDKKNPRIVPVTCAVVQNAEYDVVNDVYVLGDVPMHQVTLVGIVTSITENRTNLSFEIDDLTGGAVTVKRWLDQEDTPDEYQRAVFREDTYVRVHGYIKRLDEDKRHIVAFAMNRVTDLNEITFHIFDVVNAMMLLRKIIHDENNPNAANTTTQFGNNSISAQGDQFGQDLDSNMTKPQIRVLEMISQITSPDGISITDLTKRLNMAEPNVRDAIEFLCNEGHIYSTTDDEHYRSTSS